MLHLLIFGGRGGSGGYSCHINSILGSDKIPEGCRITLLCSPTFAKSLGPLNAKVQIMVEHNLENPLLARFWRSVRFPKLLSRLNPDLLFISTGSVFKIKTNIPIVTACHNLLLFDKKEYNKYRYTKIWLRYLLPMRRR